MAEGRKEAIADTASSSTQDNAWVRSNERSAVRRVAAVAAGAVILLDVLAMAGLLLYNADARTDREAADARALQASLDLSDARADVTDAETRIALAQADLDALVNSPNSDDDAAALVQSQLTVAQADLEAALGRASDLSAIESEASESALRARDRASNVRTIAAAVVLLVLGVSLVAALGVSAYAAEKRRGFENRLLLDQAAQAGEEPQAIKSDGDNPLDMASRWLNNRSRLEAYHRLVTNYATSSRTLTLITLGGGFSFLILVALVGAFAGTTAAAIGTSIVGASGATLTAFAANAVLRNAEASSRELLAFFTHPLEVERLLAAEHLVSDMPAEQQASARLMIIQGLTATNAARRPTDAATR